MKKTLAITLSSLVLATILFGSILNGSKTTTMLANAAASPTNPSQQCKDAANKISDKAEATQSNGVCTIELSRDSPSMQLFGHKFNEFTPQEVRYGTVGNNNVLMIFEFTLLASEVNPVAKSFENNGVTVTAIHNHWLFEHPILYYMHAEKTGDLNTLLQDAKDALSKTSG
jgi:Domain of Unknown Function (DUF1259)